MSSLTSNLILCCYHNCSCDVQVARITNVESWYFERVVFPGQRLLFEAPAEAELEVFRGQGAAVMRVNQVPCAHLQVTTRVLSESLVS